MFNRGKIFTYNKFKKSWLVKKLYQIKIKNEVLQTQ